MQPSPSGARAHLLQRSSNPGSRGRRSDEEEGGARVKRKRNNGKAGTVDFLTSVSWNFVSDRLWDLGSDFRVWLLTRLLLFSSPSHHQRGDGGAAERASLLGCLERALRASEAAAVGNKDKGVFERNASSHKHSVRILVPFFSPHFKQWATELYGVSN
jgi:hypothetical protein